MNNIFSYVVKIDAGFAPNPFGGFLTLACCKPMIRRVAQKGDFLIGTANSKVGNRKLVYAAEISAVVTMEEYGKLPPYKIKRPSTTGKWWEVLGDNIYAKVGDKWKQRTNSDHGPDCQERDLSGNNVLICKKFWYFGEEPIDIPKQFWPPIKKGPGHKRIKPNDEKVGQLIEKFTQWLNTLPKGIQGTAHLRDELAEKCSQKDARKC